jgi:hypothetical protein
MYKDDLSYTFKGFDHGTDPFKLHFEKSLALEFQPYEIHHKVDATTDNGPGFCIVMTNGILNVYGQISLKMMNEALNSIGYKIEKI